jgi:small subunit ribosomal protein S27Ae
VTIDCKNMLIYVQGLGSTQALQVAPDTSIAQVCEQAGVEGVQWGGRGLRGELSLADYGVYEGVYLHALDMLLGGAKKKKKRVYTTPKKKHHKKKKVKLAALNIYKVDRGDKVTRIKKVCARCGEGTFMAKHFDRHYCGKCHATLVFQQA